MVFEAVSSNGIDKDEFFIDLLNNPKALTIKRIDDLKPSNNGKPSEHFFYIHFEIIKTSEIVKIGFNVKLNEDGTIYIGEGAKLYPLLSFASGIKGEAIRCNKDDIDGLIGLEFNAKSVRRKFGNKSYYVLIPTSKGDE
jgi:hypothetical protein